MHVGTTGIFNQKISNTRFCWSAKLNWKSLCTKICSTGKTELMWQTTALHNADWHSRGSLSEWQVDLLEHDGAVSFGLHVLNFPSCKWSRGLVSVKRSTSPTHSPLLFLPLFEKGCGMGCHRNCEKEGKTHTWNPTAAFWYCRTVAGVQSGNASPSLPRHGKAGSVLQAAMCPGWTASVGGIWSFSRPAQAPRAVS